MGMLPTIYIAQGRVSLTGQKGRAADAVCGTLALSLGPSRLIILA